MSRRTCDTTAAERKFVGDLIRDARSARKLMPKEAAGLLGVSKNVFYRWERGEIGGTAVKIICWLLKDRVNSMDPLYWRERALLAERRLATISHEIKEYAVARNSIEVGSPHADGRPPQGSSSLGGGNGALPSRASQSSSV